TDPESALDVMIATSFWHRLSGLLGRPPLAPGQALWLYPCHAIHTLGMSYSIDVLFLDERMQPVKRVLALRPNRFCWCKGATSVLELPAGLIDDYANIAS
ncbi:MAG: DUF192 domain-containing protein, partial [Pusillimonas sp.]